MHIDLCTLPCCVITFQYLRDCCLHRQKNKKVGNDSHSGPSTRGKGMCFNRSSFFSCFLSLHLGQTNTLPLAYTNAICPLPLFLSMGNSLRSGARPSPKAPWMVLPMESHLEPVPCRGARMEMWDGDSCIPVQNVFYCFVDVPLFVLENHKEKSNTK